MFTKDGTLLINIIVETSASPQLNVHIQPEFSSFSIFVDDNKLKRAVHTMPELPPHKYRTYSWSCVWAKLM